MDMEPHYNGKKKHTSGRDCISRRMTACWSLTLKKLLEALAIFWNRRNEG
jgi:hypothetical protein